MIIVLEIIVSILLSFAILVQHRTSGLTSTFGGSGAVVVQRRGAERVLFTVTIWLSALFFVLSLASLALNA